MWWSTQVDSNRLPMPAMKSASVVPAPASEGIVLKDKGNGRVLKIHRGYTLERADLSRGRLRYVDLRGHNLHLANLNGANLWGADLRETDLRGADLRGANLRRVNLEGAKLAGANLTGAMYDSQTVWPEGFDLTWEAVELVDD